MQKKLGIAVVSHPLLRLALAHGHRHRMGFVALELAMLVAPAATRPAVARYAAPAIIGVTTSAAMIAFAFASHADGLLIFPTIGLGFSRLSILSRYSYMLSVSIWR